MTYSSFGLGMTIRSWYWYCIFFLNTYTKVAIVTSFTLFSSLLPRPRRLSFHLQDCRSHSNHVGASNSWPSLLPPDGRRSCDVQECRSHSNHVGANTSFRWSCHLWSVSLATSETSHLPHLQRLTCDIWNVGLATFATSLLPRLQRLSCHVWNVGLATFATSLLPRLKRHNIDEN